MKQQNSKKTQETSKILLENTPWEAIYERYAKEIITNKNKYGINSKRFQVNKPLLVYSSLSKVKSDLNTTAYDLRFAGQSVGLIEVNKEAKVMLTVSKSQAKYAKENFNFSMSKELDRVDWKKDADGPNGFCPWQGVA